ncbi:peptidoglycan editing factor PgeF [Lysobacter auxotrophicus]|uniref:Purine nucleoside phosphorylase n=1 Tax=Lysobacter auxotrophicus TaxID=2992573 RepID=A0ABN6UJ07_9GAMM|nr:peptidoglycan editing factor PgeF [Lysobacter auxotrophicus]BDU15568.1 peptidoglycan editing factor PgeF [Lysobacter auxotrophicus]
MAAAWIDAQWPAPARVHGFTTLRHGLGVSAPPFDHFNLGLRAGDDAEAVERNRALLIEHARLPSAPCWLRQVHGTQVHRFDAPSTSEVEADASVTSEPGVVLAILTADCLPVLFCADDGSEVGGAHAGWRGLAGGVLENTLAVMRTAPDRVHAWLGPAAGPQAYEIGQDVFDAFVSDDAGARTAFLATRPGHWRVDLYALARRRLQAAGVRPERIHGGGLCTISEPQRFFSHRRDQRGGRMASLVWIEPRG